jgi:hypothetical protein
MVANLYDISVLQDCMEYEDFEYVKMGAGSHLLRNMREEWNREANEWLAITPDFAAPKRYTRPVNADTCTNQCSADVMCCDCLKHK